jgi:hypothetical protein
MELHARLIHTEAGLRVVEVRASRGEHSLGSALAEARTAQEAEDLAIARLLRRLEVAPTDAAAVDPGPMEPSGSASGGGTAPRRPAAIVRRSPAQLESVEHRSTGSDAASATPAQAELSLPAPQGAQTMPNPGQAPAAVTTDAERNPPAASAGDPDPAVAAEPPPSPEASPQGSSASEPVEPATRAPLPEEPSPASAPDPQEEPPADPEDWSQELTAIDLQLRRLGWNREQEGTYLQRAFAHPSRSRLTRYGDLRAYLMALEALERGSDPAVAAVPLRRSELLAMGDALLAQLGWSAEQGRAFLERELQRISRQHLSDVQLLQFNMLLEGELLAAGTPLAPPAPDGAQR